MPPASVDQDGDLDGIYLVIPGDGTDTIRESVWNGPAGAGEGDWEGGHGGSFKDGLSVLIGGTI
jgi:hypothetical protein